jgi:hypothetical protein
MNRKINKLTFLNHIKTYYSVTLLILNPYMINKTHKDHQYNKQKKTKIITLKLQKK